MNNKAELEQDELIDELPLSHQELGAARQPQDKRKKNAHHSTAGSSVPEEGSLPVGSTKQHQQQPVNNNRESGSRYKQLRPMRLTAALDSDDNEDNSSTSERRDVISVSQCCNMMETEDVSSSLNSNKLS